ncbi:MAG: DNA cytosine methyltransferase [Candidatus Shapirobacteria bacterium]|jgi:DNA (cytosine-5)-methyltransferase 1
MNSKFTFIDLFAGIGGFRIALERCGGKCLGFSEIEPKAIETYKENFIKKNDNEWELGDIQKINKLPTPVDVIVGGVPCQSWSVAGKMRGFEDPRGKLWHDAIRLVKLNRPKVFVFENVKGLADPRNKENLNLIVNSFKELGYTIPTPQLLNSYDFGLPQNRERIFIVGFNNDVISDLNFSYPKKRNIEFRLSDFLDGLEQKTVIKKKINPKELFDGKIPLSRNKFQVNDELNDFFVFCDARNGHSTIHSWDLIPTSNREKEICYAIMRNRRKKVYGEKDGNPLGFKDIDDLVSNLKKEELEGLVLKRILRKVEGGKFDLVNSKNSSGINGIYRVFLPNSKIFSTITATGTRDHVATVTISGRTPEEYRRNFIKKVYEKGNFRQITPREAGLLQGFGHNFKLNRQDRISLKQFGNAVSVNVVYALMESIIKTGIF